MQKTDGEIRMRGVTIESRNYNKGKKWRYEGICLEVKKFLLFDNFVSENV